MMISTRFEEFTIIQTYFFSYFLLDIKWYSGGCLKLGLQTDVKVWFQTAFILSLALCGCLRHIALITGTPPTFCSYLLFPGGSQSEEAQRQWGNLPKLHASHSVWTEIRCEVNKHYFEVWLMQSYSCPKIKYWIWSEHKKSPLKMLQMYLLLHLCLITYYNICLHIVHT